MIAPVVEKASSVALRTADQLFYEITTKADEPLNGMLGAVKTTVDAASAMRAWV